MHSFQYIPNKNVIWMFIETMSKKLTNSSFSQDFVNFLRLLRKASSPSFCPQNIWKECAGPLWFLHILPAKGLVVVWGCEPTLGYTFCRSITSCWTTAQSHWKTVHAEEQEFQSSVTPPQCLSLPARLGHHPHRYSPLHRRWLVRQKTLSIESWLQSINLVPVVLILRTPLKNQLNQLEVH